MGKDITRSQVATMSCPSKISRKTNIKRIPEDQDKENTGPVVEKDVKASSRLADVSTNEALTKVRKKTAHVPPLTLPTSSPLSPAADEFHLSIYLLPAHTGNTLSSMISSLSLTPPFSPHIPPTSVYQNHQPHRPSVTAVVEQPGFISLRLRHGVVLDISANMAIRLKNISKDSSISLSSCTTQMALGHLKGRMLQ